MTNQATTETEQQTAPPAVANDSAAQTPAMRQYFAAKQAHPDCLMFIRIGDFYELFYEDAIVASRELQLTLTSRDREKKQPMCGVPYHAAEQYIQRLLRKGYRVALCEQTEDPKLTKKLVRREVTRVLTPGTVADSALGTEQSNWLASVCTRGAGPASIIGLVLLDLSTGDLRATEFSGASAPQQLADELGRLHPSELLLAESDPTLASSHAALNLAPARAAAKNGSPSNAIEPPDASSPPTGTHTRLEDWVFTADYALPLLQRHFQIQSLDGIGLGAHEPAATAAGAMLHYLQKTMQGGLEHIDTIRFYERSECLVLDSVSVRNLELVEPLFSGESTQTTLFHTLDACCTPMGRRLLRATLLRPSADLIEINSRLDAVAEAAADLPRRESLRRALSGVLDMERLLGRIALDSAGPREVTALAATLACLPGVQTATAAFKSQHWQQIAAGRGFSRTASAPNSTAASSTSPPDSQKDFHSSSTDNGKISTTISAAPSPPLDALADLRARITQTLVEEPPVSLADGGAIRSGVDAELDELRDLSHSGRQALASIEERERRRTGIASLKVRFNSVFGYYIEITKANARAVPSDYERKQTLVNAERFTTPELKDYETKILTAQERSLEIERRIFAQLRRSLLDAAPRIRETARRVAEIDLLSNFAHLSALRGWVRPQVDDSTQIEILAGRHPVVERRMEDAGEGRFVPNSLSLDAWNPHAADSGQTADDAAGTKPASIALITGPNMGGKSTYLRQAALLVIMAQSGCFVPAERMSLGLVDRIYTRIGASDNVARGRSTFMVEMTETAAILNTATPRSLVLLDEMGRGTATYDGLSLAWATVEHLHNTIGARTLFATHYHELTLLAERLTRLRNLRVTVKENANGIVFLHSVETGAASKSYGIEVARLAGLPAAVIARAREVLKLHERAESQTQQTATALANSTTAAPALQMTMFTPLSQKIVDRIAALDTDNLTPRDALNLLAELKQELGS
ncbi:MAG TPA: DNA mismatch repair protein MutS [Acidobacteriaceae bacterium]|nr:DNA mismatch repair protein MutS [Acidobacteriaceae bacterium]